MFLIFSWDTYYPDWWIHDLKYIAKTKEEYEEYCRNFLSGEVGEILGRRIHVYDTSQMEIIAEFSTNNF